MAVAVIAAAAGRRYSGYGGGRGSGGSDSIFMAAAGNTNGD